MEEDIKGRIQRKIWTVEELLPQAKELAGKADKLPKEARKSMPIFSGEWSENNVKKYLEKLGTAVRDPLRFKNRKVLENIDVQTKGISEETFDDSTGIGDTVELFSGLKEFNEVVTNILIEKGVLSGWFREGVDKAKEKLKEILNAKPAFQRIFENCINEKLRDELIQKSIEDTKFINSAEDIVSRVNFIDEFGISIEYNGKFDEFNESLRNVNNALTNLQEGYGIQKGEISEIVKEKTLHEADEFLKKKLENCSMEKSKLLEEWKMYSTTLKSIGREVPEAPRGLHKLERRVKELKSECMSTLGAEGLKLLGFLKGVEDFPDMPKDDIRKVLEILRPLFVKFLKEVS